VFFRVRACLGGSCFSKCAALHTGIVIAIEEIVVLFATHSAEHAGIIVAIETGTGLAVLRVRATGV
jgi:hypothetical protein